jgi:hypothetical protein
MSSAAPPSPRITALEVLDIRFPTSEHLDGWSGPGAFARSLVHDPQPHRPGPEKGALTEYAHPDGPVRPARV